MDEKDRRGGLYIYKLSLWDMRLSTVKLCLNDVSQERMWWNDGQETSPTFKSRMTVLGTLTSLLGQRGKKFVTRKKNIDVIMLLSSIQSWPLFCSWNRKPFRLAGSFSKNNLHFFQIFFWGSRSKCLGTIWPRVRLKPWRTKGWSVDGSKQQWNDETQKKSCANSY